MKIWQVLPATKRSVARIFHFVQTFLENPPSRRAAVVRLLGVCLGYALGTSPCTPFKGGITPFSSLVVPHSGMNGSLVSGLLVFAAFCLQTSAAFARIPTLAPELHSILPHGIQRGTTTAVLFRGKNLARTSKIEFFGSGLSAEMLRASDSEVLARVKAEPDTDTGRRDVRLYTDRGTVLQVFDVGALREVSEQEPNNEFEQAQTVTLPVLINGVIGPGVDYDHFKFHANAGQALIFDLNATRNGSSLDAMLMLFSDKGKLLDSIDDYYLHKDPYLTYTFRASGDYVLRVRSSDDQGSPDFDYRLTLGELPHLSNSFPAGAASGQTTEFNLNGINLSRVREIWLNEGKIRSEVLTKSNTQIRAKVTVGADWTPGISTLRVKDDNGYLSGAIAFQVSEWSEMTLTPGAGRKKFAPIPLTLPVVVNGILDERKSENYFSFRAEAGQRLQFSVTSMQLGYYLDPAITLYDELGNEVAFQDEPAPNNTKEPPNLDPLVVYRFEKAGQYLVMVRDAGYGAHPESPYRLIVQPVEPDFELRVLMPQETAQRGDSVDLLVRVRRKGGWAAPVEVWAEDLPKGITGVHLQAEPKDTRYRGADAEDFWLDGTNVDVQLQIAPETPAKLYKLRFHSRGTFEGQTVEHEGIAHYLWSGVGKISGQTQEQEVLLTVVDPLRFQLTVPPQVALQKGKPTKLKVAVNRLTSDKSVIELSIVSQPKGLSLKTGAIPTDQNFAELSLLLDRALPAEGEILTLKGEDGLPHGGSQTQYLDVRIVPDTARSDENRSD
jgi:Bacterial pre-peptidase C-terminal domain/Quinohemoprotein amine dehydrogenase, alpha subunit domain III